MPIFSHCSHLVAQHWRSRSGQTYIPGHEMQKAALGGPVDSLGIIGRDGVIRTLDPLHPMQVRYQAALRPDL